MSIERLDKIIAAGLNLSRTDAARMITKGSVTVNSQTVRQAAAKADTDTDVIRAENAVVSYRPFVYLLMNKPLGVVSATKDKGAVTVLDIVPPHLKRKGLFPAGRLDKYSQGMVVITDDGAFAHRMLAPKSHVGKTYYVEVESPVINQAMVALFEKGVFLGDGDYSSPAKLEIVTPTSGKVTIYEGIYHQVRRMFDKNGARVVKLIRIKIGGLPLDEGLAEGDCRELTTHELALLLTETENS